MAGGATGAAGIAGAAGTAGTAGTAGAAGTAAGCGAGNNIPDGSGVLAQPVISAIRTSGTKRYKLNDRLNALRKNCRFPDVGLR